MTEKKYILDRSDILALSALLISGIALIVSIYEANIMKEQQKIMFDQQQAAVWPYVDGHINYSFQENSFFISYTLINKGVGPAIIKNGRLIVNDKPLREFEDGIREAVSPFFPENIIPSVSLSLVENKVLSPGEQYQVIKLSSDRFDGDLFLAENLAISYDACFCSIYDDWWQLEEDEQGNKLECE
jgi:hypothetical protein